MAQTPLPIATYAYAKGPSAASSRLLNCFAMEAPKPGGKSPVILRRAAGIAPWIDLTTGSDVTVRGMCVMGDDLYALVGATLSRITNNGTTTTVGTIPGDERVRMQTNGTVLVIVRPTAYTGYSCDGTNTAQITDPVFLGFTAADVAFLDGYFIFRIPNSQRFFNSGLNALTFNALDVATAEAAPDNLNGLLVNLRNIFLPGALSSEVWYDAANDVGSPFSRAPDGFLSFGLAASAGLGILDSLTVWLANDKTIRRLSGVAPEKISQFGIDALIQSFGVIDDCYCVPYTFEGHVFMAFTFPFEGRTIVIDASTGEWHERESLGYGAWRASCIVNWFGRQLVGDLRSGKIGYLDQNTFEEFGEPQKCAWTYPGIYAERATVSHRRFELAYNPGHGLTVGQGSNPLLTLLKSDDGGETFRAMPTRTLGARGKYLTRVVYWNLGCSKDRVYRVEVTDPYPVFVTDTVIEAQGARI